MKKLWRLQCLKRESLPSTGYISISEMKRKPRPFLEARYRRRLKKKSCSDSLRSLAGEMTVWSWREMREKRSILERSEEREESSYDSEKHVNQRKLCESSRNSIMKKMTCQSVYESLLREAYLVYSMRNVIYPLIFREEVATMMKKVLKKRNVKI